MKYYFIFLFQLIVLSSYGQKNKEAEIDSLESEMMNFFKQRWKEIMVEKILLTYW
ncbi:hypothetical protein NXW16_03665 [Bacteroides thetaiotaomicron]|nr:hypothetical protein [Bacteroides thetaiotaomicron]